MFSYYITDVFYLLAQLDLDKRNELCTGFTREADAV